MSDQVKKMEDQFIQIKNYYELQIEKANKNHAEDKEITKQKYELWKR